MALVQLEPVHLMQMTASKFILFILTAVFALTLLWLLGKSAYRRAVVKNGWRYLAPGSIAWVGLVLNSGFSGLLSYIYLFVGNARSDSDSQMNVLLFLAVIFNLIALHIAYTTFAEEVRWNDTCVQRRTLFFETRSITWHQLAMLGVEPSGYWWIKSFDGPKIRFSPYTRGFKELVSKIMEHLPNDLPPAEMEMVQQAIVLRTS